MELFNFTISDRMRQHGKYTLNLEVTVKTNNIQIVRKDLVGALEVFIQKETEVFMVCRYLEKASHHRQQKMIEDEADKLLTLLTMIRNKTEPVFYEDRQELLGKFSTLISYLDDGKVTSQFDRIGALIEEFSVWLKEALNSKIDMCEKLAQLDRKPLKALVKFSEEGFETHFTKYHLNLERFAVLMHKILQAELSLQYINHYQELEKEHFILTKSFGDVESYKIENFLQLADEVLLNHTKIDKIHKLMLQAQVKGDKIKDNIRLLTQTIYQISQKFDEIYLLISKRNAGEEKIKSIFSKMMGILSQLSIKDFLSKKEVEIYKFYDWVAEKESIAVHLPSSGKILFSNLEKIEPDIANRLKSKVINELKLKEGAMTGDLEGQFLIKKNSKGIFDRNSFYTHTLINYEFIPKSLDQLKNRYTVTAGIDKILVERNFVRFSNRLFSPFLGKEIVCDLFLEISYYNINISNFYQTKAS